MTGVKTNNPRGTIHVKHVTDRNPRLKGERNSPSTFMTHAPVMRRLLSFKRAKN
jgi:hypothetical protein